MFYKTLIIVLTIIMGFIIHDLYTVLENQDELFSTIYKLRAEVKQTITK
jgi:hypothetical protein